MSGLGRSIGHSEHREAEYRAARQATPEQREQTSKRGIGEKAASRRRSPRYVAARLHYLGRCNAEHRERMRERPICNCGSGKQQRLACRIFLGKDVVLAIEG